MIEISEDVEIKQIDTQKKIVSEGSGDNKTEREAEFLIFKLRGKTIALNIKGESFEHPLLKLRENGLRVEANITLKISNPQKSLLEFGGNEDE